jgi:hypothetical protein
MKIYYRIKRILKLFRLELRRYKVARRWGKDALAQAPSVYGNAIPKAGSHLLIQVLQGLTEVGPFVNPGFPPVNRFEDNSKLPIPDWLNELKRMRSGEIRYGYTNCIEPFIEPITAPGRASVFIYRDPRDLCVSLVFYATNMHKGHHMHEYFNNELSTMEERLNIVIEGCDLPGLKMANTWERYEGYLGWFEKENVLCLKFEDLILNREKAIDRLLDYLEGFGVEFIGPRSEAIKEVSASIEPRRSGTFRKGKPGNWKEHFTEDNKRKFKAVAGDLLTRLGYEESDQNW